MTNLYLENILKKEKKEEYRNHLIFGYTFSIFLLLLAFYMILNNKILYQIPLFIGVGILLIVIINPNWEKYPYFVVSKIFNLLGKIILWTLLIALYIVYIIPVGLIIQLCNRNKEQRKSNFFDKSEFVFKLDDHKKLKTVLNLFALFTRREYIMFLPLIIILVLIGIALLFTQSSFIAPFIYSLF